MAKKMKKSAVFMRGFFAAFLLVCIFFSVFPHMHICEGNECFLCELREMFSEIVFVAGLCFVLPLLFAFCRGLLAVSKQTAGDTLVQLKVKLSD